MTESIESLERLGRLRQQGLLTRAEFESEKAWILQARTASVHSEELTERAQSVFEYRRIAAIIAAALILLVVAAAVYWGTPPEDDGGSPEGIEAAASGKEPVAEARISLLMKFERPAECEPGDELKVLFDEMRALDEREDGRRLIFEPLDTKLHPAVKRLARKGGDDAIIAELSIPGSWEGLKVAGLRTVSFEESGVRSIQVRFQDPPEKVLRTLNEQGFDLPKVGELRNAELENGSGLSVGVEGLSGGAALTCAMAPTRPEDA